MSLEPDLFDVCAGKHGGNTESKAANLDTNKSRDLSRIVTLLKAVPNATADEVAVKLVMPCQTCSARFADLKVKGWIISAGVKRPTRTGSMAQAWKLAMEL